MGMVPNFEPISLFDLNIRDQTSDTALRIFVDFLTILESRNPKSVNFFKVDSLLRGNLAVQVSLLAERNPQIFIPAVPSLNRLVQNGEVFIQNVPLNETDLWKNEQRIPPKKIRELFPDLKVIDGKFNAIQDTENVLNRMSAGEIFIPDITTTEDIATISHLLKKFPHVIPLGSAEFAAAHFRAFQGGHLADGEDVVPRGIVSATVVIGSHSEASRSQLAYLQSLSHMPLSAEDKYVEVTHRDDLTDLYLGNFQSQALFISGGTTARRILDAAGITRLRMLNALEYGVALGISAEGQLIGIKPGSFGREDTISKSLATMLAISTLSNRN